MLFLSLDEDSEAVTGTTIISSPGGSKITHFLDWEGTREHVGRIERGKCIPSVQTLYDLEKALNLPECSLVKRLNGQAEADVSQGSGEKEQVGRACRELELALAANLAKSNLRKAITLSNVRTR